MNSPEKTTSRQSASLKNDTHYKSFLHDIKTRLKTAQIRAALAVNRELIMFYWQLGKDIIEKQQAFKWGDNFIQQLSDDMRKMFPSVQGYSIRNLHRMRQFAALYPDLAIVPQAVAQIPWGHICLLIHKVKDELKRTWYINQTIKNGWSRSVLEMQIESGLYERQGKADTKISNFQDCLPAPQSDLAHDLLKDPYNFDFLTIESDAKERAIENALTTHVRDFLLELGQGFAFVGSQVPITIGEEEFFIDLLFYHLHLRAFVVIELKANKFKPAYAGQLGFYLAAVDNTMKKDTDNQTIGILLCKSKDKIVADYALQYLKAPIGVADYQLSKELPEGLEDSLPTVEEIETELNDYS